MTITPVRREHLFLGSAPRSAFNDEIYGRRMQLLLGTGASRLLDVDTDSMVAAAMGPLTDEDMVDQFIGAVDQVQFNEMKKRMEALPTQMQTGEFVDGVAEAGDAGEVEVAIAISPFGKLMPGGEDVGDFDKALDRLRVALVLDDYRPVAPRV